VRVEWQPRDEVLARLRARYRAAQWKSDPERYAAWLRTLEVVPTVAALRSRVEELRRAELERTLARTSMSEEDRERIEAMTAAFVKKLLHAPIRRLKEPGKGQRYVEATRALFDLDPDGPSGRDGRDAPPA